MYASYMEETYNIGSHLVTTGWTEEDEFYFNAMPILRFEYWSVYRRADGFEWVDTSQKDVLE